MQSKASGTADESAVAARLVRRVLAGDRDAEAEMVERYSRGLRYLLLRLTGTFPSAI